MARIPKTSDNATLLLAASYKLTDGPRGVVSRASHYEVSDEIAEEAGFDPETGELKDGDKPKRTTKKAAAKKTAASSSD